MHFEPGPTTAQLLAAFTDEITARGGRVTETVDDGRRLLARSVLPLADDVRPGDRLRGGVALRAAEGEVWVHPYLFRLVCTNGAIIARSVATRHLTALAEWEPDDAVRAVREAVAACCEPEVFADNFDRVLESRNATADHMLALMPLLTRFAELGHPQLLELIMEQFFHERDHSRYGLGNAITAAARQLPDPDRKWELEEFGGGVLVGAIRPTPGPTLSAAARADRAVPADLV